MRFIQIIALFCFFNTCICLTSIGQKWSYELIKTNPKIEQNQPLTMSIVVSTFEEIPQPQCVFPEYSFFKKLGISKSKSTKYLEGKKQTNYQITQSYLPQKNGTFTLPEDYIQVEGQKIKKESITVTVSGYADKIEPLQAIEQVFDETEFDNIANKEAFLLLKCSNKNPYVGEGFTLTLTFFVSENNVVPMRFEKNDIQIPEIIKKIKPINCWEESHHLSEAIENTVQIKGKKMKSYTFYKATFFALNEKTIVVAKQTLFLKTDVTDATKQKFIYFVSNPLSIRPKALPSHPLKNKIIVGQYQLKEFSSSVNSSIGKAIQYTVQLIGNGNVSTIEAPILEANNQFDFYTPTETTHITAAENGILSNKSFTFSIIPKQAGKFALDKYFYWIYFDPSKARYDTLRSNLQVNIKGEGLLINKNAKISEDIYDGLEDIPTKLNEVNYAYIVQTQFNAIVFILTLCMMYVFLKSNNKNKR